MLRKLSKEEIYIITNRLTQGILAIMGEKVRSIILYGSYARGDYDDESDIDVMVLADVNEDEERKFGCDLCSVSSELGLEFDKVISILTYNKSLFDEHLKFIPFNQNVIKDGLPLYVS
jgi:predicted nucleotidyltransferase